MGKPLSHLWNLMHTAFRRGVERQAAKSKVSQRDRSLGAYFRTGYSHSEHER